MTNGFTLYVKGKAQELIEKTLNKRIAMLPSFREFEKGINVFPFLSDEVNHYANIEFSGELKRNKLSMKLIDNQKF